MMLAAAEVLKHMQDHPWEGWTVEIAGVRFTLMTSAIASMLLTAAILIPVILLMARRYRKGPVTQSGVLEVVVVFVRDMIARPTLKEHAYDYLPFLLTLFIFILSMNLLGIVPLAALSEVWPGPDHPIGHTATSVPTACAGLASLTLLMIFYGGLKNQAWEYHVQTGRPVWLCLLMSPILWLKSLSPHVPGPAGVVLLLPLVLLEFIGAIAKCFSLMIRLCANMLAGHTLLAVLFFLLFVQTQGWIERAYVGPWVIAGSVVVNLLELLVAGLQAYIFTFLTAMFLKLYTQPSH